MSACVFTISAAPLDIELTKRTASRQGGIVLIAETVSLGILSLPWALSELGLIPGVVVILVLGGMATYSGLMIGEFKKVYPAVNNFGDAVEIMGQSIGMGRVFQEVFGWAQTLFQVFVSASHLLTWTICLNHLTDSSVCTIVWAASGMVLFWLCNLPRTLKWTSVMSGVCKLTPFPRSDRIASYFHDP